jgi:hypothetical protein
MMLDLAPKWSDGFPGGSRVFGQLYLASRGE